MSQILLSSQRLGNAKVLQEGQIDVFEALEKHPEACAVLQLESRPPKKTLILEWKEIITPSTPASMSDLAGKKLAEYKFQYLGQFKYGGEPVEVAQEAFEASLGEDQSINHDLIESEGWVNCTWLIDFLVNAPAIESDPLRDETLTWHKEGKKGHFIDLKRQTIGNGVAEQQHFVFKDEYQTLEWSHKAIFE